MANSDSGNEKKGNVSVGGVVHVDFAIERKKREKEEEDRKDREALEKILEYAKSLKW